VFYFGAAHLTLPLPLSLPLRLNVGDFRTQLFAQIGNLLQIYSTSRPTQQQQQPHPQRMTMSNILDELKSTTRANVGIGLVWRTLFGMRVELNYTVPIWSQPNDQIKNLQIGVSFQFL
jgi:outer membrane protein assembly factor BamA